MEYYFKLIIKTLISFWNAKKCIYIQLLTVGFEISFFLKLNHFLKLSFKYSIEIISDSKPTFKLKVIDISIMKM